MRTITLVLLWLNIGIIFHMSTLNQHAPMNWIAAVALLLSLHFQDMMKETKDNDDE